MSLDPSGQPLSEAQFRELARRGLASEPSPAIFDARTGRAWGPSDWDLNPELKGELAAMAPPRSAAVLVPIVLRAELTVPEQFIAGVAVGQPITFEVDAYPKRQFTGKIRFVSPALKADQRALTIEAVVPNAGSELKPGLFATARIQQPNPTPAVLVPATAVQTTGGTSPTIGVRCAK